MKCSSCGNVRQCIAVAALPTRMHPAIAFYLGCHPGDSVCHICLDGANVVYTRQPEHGGRAYCASNNFYCRYGKKSSHYTISAVQLKSLPSDPNDLAAAQTLLGVPPFLTGYRICQACFQFCVFKGVAMGGGSTGSPVKSSTSTTRAYSAAHSAG